MNGIAFRVRAVLVALGLVSTGGLHAAPYPQAELSDSEQLMLELMNRARSNPAAEAARFGIGLNDGLPAGSLSNFTRQPLAAHPALWNAARMHSQWVLDSGTFSHTGAGGSNPGQRMQTSGYPFSGNWTWGENLSANANVEEAHAALFRSASHRQSLLNPAFDETGPGLLTGDYLDEPTLISTLDFARSDGTPGPLVTGVVYFDLDADGAYDVGEGIGGVTVSANGTEWTASTGTAGGFALPVPGDGTYVVQFNAPNLSVSPVTIQISGGTNRKLDLVPPYVPPALSGPHTLGEGESASYSFAPINAATGYEAASARYVAGNYSEGAESGGVGVVLDVSPGYAVVQSSVKAAGSFAFQLAQPQTRDQILELAEVFCPNAGSVLSFRKRLGWAMPGQVAQAQVSVDDGRQWSTVWSQAGTGGSGDSGFALVTVPLGTYAGQELRIRFVYDYVSGSYFPQTDSGIGFYLDDIAVSGVSLQAEEQVVPLGTATGFDFAPDLGGTWLLRVRGLLPGRTLPWGPARAVFVESGSEAAVPSLSAPVWESATRTRRADLLVWQAVTGAVSYVVERSDSGTWSVAATTASTSQSVKWSKKNRKKTYIYRIQAVAADGTRSPYSAEVRLP